MIAERPSRPRTGPVVAAVALWASFLALAVPGVALLAANRPLGDIPDVPLLFVALLSNVTVGALIAALRPTNPIGWLLCALVLSVTLQLFAQEYAQYAIVTRPGSLPAGAAVSWFYFWPRYLIGLLAFVFLLFPDGRLPSPRWRPVARFAAWAMAVLTVIGAFEPNGIEVYPTIRNPLGLAALAGVADVVDGVVAPLLYFPLLLASAAALFGRYSRAAAEERVQLKWFAYAAALLIAYSVASPPLMSSNLIPGFAALAELITAVLLVLLSASIGIAILRHRLYDVDVLINRTLVYVGLTAILGGAYTGALAFFQRMFVAVTGQGSDLAIVFTLFVLATAFTPIKNSLQTFVDQRFKVAGAHATVGGRSAAECLALLAQLAELRDRGVVTTAEFEAKKAELLARV